MTILSEILNTGSGSASGGIQSVVAGTNMLVDDADTQNPVISCTLSLSGSSDSAIFSTTSTGAINIGDPVVLNNDSTVSIVELITTITGTPITLEGEETFHSPGSITNMDMVQIGDDKWVIAYDDSTISNIRFRVLTRVNGVLQVGSIYNYGGVTTSKGIRLEKIEDDRFLIAYVDHLDDIQVAIGQANGSTLGFGTGIELSSSSSGVSFDIAVLTPGEAVCVAQHSSSDYFFQLLISGMTVTEGVSSNYGAVGAPRITRIDNWTVLFAYTNANFGYVTQVALYNNVFYHNYTVYNTSGAVNRLVPRTMYYDSINTKWKVLLAYASANSRTYAVLLTVDTTGRTISLGTPITMHWSHGPAAYFPNLVKINNNYAAAVLDGGSSADVTYAWSIKIDESTEALSYSGPYTLTTGEYRYYSIAPYDVDKFLAIYADGSYIGRYQIGQLQSESLSTADNYIGISQTTVADNESVDVLVNGVDTNQSGLIIDDNYYLADNGDINNTDNGRLIGEGVSATDLLLKQLPILSHNLTTNRDATDAHPISAITSLQTALNNKLDTTYDPWEVGDVIQSYRSLDSSWLSCDGSEYLDSSYPTLAVLMDDGPTGAAYFVVPNLTGSYYIKAE